MAPSTSPSVPTLPPSVEEAYRRKCVYLKQRQVDLEEANDAVRLRLARLKRQVEKQRLERAFLLEQLAKRTSTNVEDSDGSPSPPATPKDKPLRTKRGHRKNSVGDGSGAPGSTFISQNLDPLSPSSDVFSKGDSQSQPTQSTPAASQRRGGRKPKAAKDGDDAADASGKGKGGDDDKEDGKGSGALKRPGNAFELYCEEMRPALMEKRKANKKKKGGEDGDDVDMEDADAEEEEEDEAAIESSIDAELARGWTEMEQGDKDEFETRAAEEQAKYKKAKEEARQQKQKEKDDKEAEAEEADEAKDKDGEKAEGDDDKADDADKKDADKEKEAPADDAAEKDEAKDADEKAESKDAEPEDKEAEPAKGGEDTEMADPDSVAVATSSGDKDD